MVSVRAGARARYWHSNNKALEIARDVKAWLSGRYRERQKFKKRQEQRNRERQKLKRKRQEQRNRERQEWLSKLHAARVARDRVELAKLKRERLQQKQAAIGSGKGRLPDFVVIGAKKCGTTLLYHLLTQHPYVDPAAKKELHYFDGFFDEGIDWYRRCFAPQKWKDGRRTITGEATPYLQKLSVAERMAKVIPQAQLIVLLRNPVDRAYSDYQQTVRLFAETKTFEEAITTEERWRDGRAVGGDYVERGIYVDQLLHWTKFFSRDQILVLKSEDFFERTSDTLDVVLKFLRLSPTRSPELQSLLRKKRNKGEYQQGMSLVTRRRLEEYFEPHNRRLYEYLDVDFGW